MSDDLCMSLDKCDNVVLPCQCLFDKCKSFVTKTIGELKKWPNDDEFRIYNINLSSRYPSMQEIRIEDAGDNGNSIYIQCECKDHNKTLVELYTFGFDAYKQVTQQLIDVKKPWRIQLSSMVEVECVNSKRELPLRSPAVHFDNKSEITPHYVETFKKWEKEIVARVCYDYRVLYFAMNVYMEDDFE